MKEKRTLLVLVGVIVALIGLVLISGCTIGPDVSYDYAISQPYAIKSGVIEMRVNATAMVLLNNSAGGDLKFNVKRATMSAVMEDGSIETVDAALTGGSVPADGSYVLNLTFNGVPVKYVLLDNPPRFHSLVRYYDVNVTYSGQTKLLILWSPTQTSVKGAHMPIEDMPVGDYFNTFLGKVSLK